MNSKEFYTPVQLKQMFNGKKVSPTLPYDSPLKTNDLGPRVFENSLKYISISGFQEKYSMVLDGGSLRLSQIGEQGHYILKPIPSFLKNGKFAPANEHLTMQIAQQLFKIECAPNVLVFFKDGSPAYLTKRFDVKENGEKLAVEDFASILGKAPHINGENYKYTGNYFELFSAMQLKLPAWKIEAPKLFKLILFNYLFSNGDAHFKNFSVIETQQGDFKLSPAYDLLNTKIHIENSAFALSEGLLPKQLSKGKTRDLFVTLGKEASLSAKIVEKLISEITSNQEGVIAMVNSSYLNDKLKRNYIQSYQTKLKTLFHK